MNTRTASPLTVDVSSDPSEGQMLVLAQRMLRRLPPSIWDQSLETPQGHLYQAIAGELGLWLDAWRLVRQCTLLQEADGIDLDVLLRDYALKRYNQRPDQYARQVARQILWTPKGTLYAIQEVATLLTDSPQLCGRSGRMQPHWWVAITQPLYMPRTYWQLSDLFGAVWYLSLEENDLCLSQFPPPGANATPWPDGYSPIPGGGPPVYAGGWEDVATIYWFRVADALGVLWYASVGTGGNIRLSLERPGPEPGTQHVVQLLDGAGEVWGLSVEAETMSLTIEPLSTPQTSPTYWQMVDTTGQIWLVIVDRGTVALLAPPAPLGWRDLTPGGIPLDWVALDRPDAPGTVRYAQIHPDDLLMLLDAEPVSGVGTSEPIVLRDVADNTKLWDINLDRQGQAIEIRLIPEPPVLSGDPIIVLDPQVQAEYVVLHDQAGTPWYIWRSPVEWALSTEQPSGMVNMTPAGGPYTWWRWAALDGSALAVSVVDGACLAASNPAPPGAGMAEPQSLGDTEGTRWHFGIAPDGSLGLSDWPPVDFAQAATCLVMNDPTGLRWYWRVEAETQELVMSSGLEPDTIPWQALGEIGWLRASDPGGGLDWYMMSAFSQEFNARHAPAQGQSWGLEAHETPVFGQQGRPWTFVMDVDGSLAALPGANEDIPPAQPIFYARDCAEALRHVEAAGSITTLWAR